MCDDVGGGTGLLHCNSVAIAAVAWQSSLVVCLRICWSLNAIAVSASTSPAHSPSTGYVQAAVGRLFREALGQQGFQEIHTPKLIGGTSEVRMLAQHAPSVESCILSAYKAAGKR